MKSADISIIGPDSKGIVATITNFIFENQCNIEEVSQNVVNGTFFMNVKISINKKKFDKEIFNKELAREAKQLGMKTVYARYGDVFNTLNSGADYDIDNISELLSIIKKENKY